MFERTMRTKSSETGMGCSDKSNAWEQLCGSDFQLSVVSTLATSEVSRRAEPGLAQLRLLARTDMFIRQPKFDFCLGRRCILIALSVIDAVSDRFCDCEFGSRLATTPKNPRLRPPMIPGTFTAIVVGRKDSSENRSRCRCGARLCRLVRRRLQVAEVGTRAAGRPAVTARTRTVTTSREPTVTMWKREPSNPHALF